ncbi:MAG: DUF3426 domain-containing protein [Cellvibrionaceae bacterium]|nr:DUF3426 domain-containing protein [Cellvibrionaceae bacterium]
MDLERISHEPTPGLKVQSQPELVFDNTNISVTSSHQLEADHPPTEAQDLDAEAWAMELLNEDDSAQPTDDEPRFSDDDTKDFKHQPSGPKALTQAIKAEQLEDQDEAGQDEAWAVNMIMEELQPQAEEPVDSRPELEPEAETIAKMVMTSEVSKETAESEFPTSEPSGQKDDETELSLTPIDDKVEPLITIGDNKAELEAAPRKPKKRRKKKTKNQADQSKSEMIAGIEPEPLEMQFAANVRNYRWLWAVACVVAAAVLIAQLAWLKYDQLNRLEPYRSYYGLACKMLNCELPPQIDLKRLKTSKLVVRSHPEADNALIVEMVILNTAQFEQEFPKIELSFNDIDGKPVASRVFTPAEYLAGELAGAKLMPIKRPIHLLLNIIDPGKNATNYRVRVI